MDTELEDWRTWCPIGKLGTGDGEETERLDKVSEEFPVSERSPVPVSSTASECLCMFVSSLLTDCDHSVAASPIVPGGRTFGDAIASACVEASVTSIVS